MNGRWRPMEERSERLTGRGRRTGGRTGSNQNTRKDERPQREMERILIRAEEDVEPALVRTLRGGAEEPRSRAKKRASEERS